MDTLVGAADLQPFIIDDVRQPTVDAPQKLGSGSYGSVELLLIGEYQLICAGKSLHSALVEAENEGVEHITSRFVDECRLMSNLRHPNVVQFLGVCFLPSSNHLPVLLMEYMATNLDSYLEKNQGIPLSDKVSILHDVAQGLAYLHSRKPPVIHRDLTATNILLNCSLSAKITDFGNSRIIHISPDQLAKTMTCVPGTLVYLPPEALNPKPKYNEKLDCFSYGQLALYTMTQKFPMPSAPTFMDPETNKVMGRTEVERREEFFELMETSTKEHVTIKKMITDCLSNDPAERPSSLHILSTVRELSVIIGCTDSGQRMLGLHKGGTLSQMEDQMAELEKLCQAQKRLLELKEEEKQQQLEEIKNAKEHLATVEKLCQTKESLLQAKESESTHLSRLLELKGKEVTELQSSGKTQKEYMYEDLRKELDDVQSKLNIRKMEIEGWERLCLAKDKLIEEKNADKRQMIEQVRQRLEEIGTDPQLLQIELDESGQQVVDNLRKYNTSPIVNQESNPEKSRSHPPRETSTSEKQDKKKKRQQKAPESEHIKIVIVGSGAVGKTCVLITYTTNQFPKVYIPTVFENYTADVYVEGRPFVLGLWDTAGQEDYDRLRPLSYPETDCFMICYSVDTPKSLEEVAEKWVPEIRYFAPSTPYFIVGLKTDLRNDESTIRELKKDGQSPVTKEEGQAMAEKVGAYAYVECSASQQKGVNTVFKEVVKCVISVRSKKRSSALFSS